MIWLAYLAVAHLAGAADPGKSAPKIRYQAETESIEIELNASQLVLRKDAFTDFISINKCNRELITNFWNLTVNDVRRLPKTAGTEFKPWLSFEGQYYLVLAMTTAGRKVSNLDVKFKLLRSQEKKLCPPP